MRPVFTLDFELMTGDGSHLIDTAKQVRIEHFRSGELTWQHRKQLTILNTMMKIGTHWNE